MKKWTIQEICMKCGYTEQFVLIPAAGETMWQCPECGEPYNAVNDCGVDPEGLSLEQIEERLEHMIGEPDEEN